MTSTDPDDFLGGLRRGEMASDHFSIISNALARDRTISYRAKGLFLNMASHKEGFRITESFLAAMGTEGVKAIRTALAELREAGYIYRGKMLRWPPGKKNDKGADISGSCAGYEWFVTDKPEEIAIILARYAQEQRAANLSDVEIAKDPAADRKPAGEDSRPKREVVLTSGNADEDLTAETAASADLRKHHEPAGGDKLPKPTGGFGSTKEDDHKKTIEEDQAGGTLPPDPLREQDPSGPAGVEPASPAVVAAQGGHQQGDHNRPPVIVRISPNFEGDQDTVDEFARLLYRARKGTQAALVMQAFRRLLGAVSKDRMKPLVDEHQAAGLEPGGARDAARRTLIAAEFEQAATKAGVQLQITWKSAVPAVDVPDLSWARDRREGPATAPGFDEAKAARIAAIRAAAGVPRGDHYEQVLRDAPRQRPGNGPDGGPGASEASLHKGQLRRRATG